MVWKLQGNVVFFVCSYYEAICGASTNSFP